MKNTPKYRSVFVCWIDPFRMSYQLDGCHCEERPEQSPLHLWAQSKQRDDSPSQRLGAQSPLQTSLGCKSLIAHLFAPSLFVATLASPPSADPFVYPKRSGPHTVPAMRDASLPLSTKWLRSSGLPYYRWGFQTRGRSIVRQSDRSVVSESSLTMTYSARTCPITMARVLIPLLQAAFPASPCRTPPRPDRAP